MPWWTRSKYFLSEGEEEQAEKGFFPEMDICLGASKMSSACGNEDGHLTSMWGCVRVLYTLMAIG